MLSNFWLSNGVTVYQLLCGWALLGWIIVFVARWTRSNLGQFLTSLHIVFKVDSVGILHYVWTKRLFLLNRWHWIFCRRRVLMPILHRLALIFWVIMICPGLIASDSSADKAITFLLISHQKFLTHVPSLYPLSACLGPISHTFFRTKRFVIMWWTHSVKIQSIKASSFCLTCFLWQVVHSYSNVYKLGE